MQKFANRISPQKEHCVSFDEASEIFKFFLNHDLVYFLQLYGLVDDFGRPNETELGGNVFRCSDRKSWKWNNKFYEKVYFITESGLKELFNIALGAYLLEKPDQIIL